LETIFASLRFGRIDGVPGVPGVVTPGNFY
jgi:hypothetical protein